MANENAITDQPDIRVIGMADLIDALTKGLADFRATPSHLIFLCVIYPVLMLVSIRVAAGYDVLPLVFPLLAGYTLIGPLVAVGMYELSRRGELGIEVNLLHAFDAFRPASIRRIAAPTILLMVIYFGWLYAAQAIYEANFGSAVPVSIADFAMQVLTTPAGWAVIFVGSGIGFVFAVVVFAISVVSFPLLLHHDVGAAVAMQISIRAVVRNPITMATWGVIVAGTLLIGSIPFFVGLAIVLPILGHATWHLYRRVVRWPHEES